MKRSSEIQPIENVVIHTPLSPSQKIERDLVLTIMEAWMELPNYQLGIHVEDIDNQNPENKGVLELSLVGEYGTAYPVRDSLKIFKYGKSKTIKTIQFYEILKICAGHLELDLDVWDNREFRFFIEDFQEKIEDIFWDDMEEVLKKALKKALVSHIEFAYFHSV